MTRKHEMIPGILMSTSLGRVSIMLKIGYIKLGYWLGFQCPVTK